MFECHHCFFCCCFLLKSELSHNSGTRALFLTLRSKIQRCVLVTSYDLQRHNGIVKGKLTQIVSTGNTLERKAKKRQEGFHDRCLNANERVLWSTLT